MGSFPGVCTPFNLTAWRQGLEYCPNAQLVAYVLNGIEHGVDLHVRDMHLQTLLQTLQEQTNANHNWSSAKEHVKFVREELASDVEAGRVQRLSPSDPPILTSPLTSRTTEKGGSSVTTATQKDEGSTLRFSAS